MFTLKSDFVIDLDVPSILQGQGINPERASARLVEAAGKALAGLDRLLQPAAIYGTLPVTDFQHERVEFAGGFFEGPLVARAAAGASELNLALCTIGPALEEKAAELMKTDMAAALVLDGAGNAAVRALTATVNTILVDAAASRGLKTGMRVNPGQEGWPIEQQRLVFKLIPAEKIGVRLTESCLMLPRKSVSFIIGAGKEMCDEAVPCDFCSKRQKCRWRKR